MRNLFLRNLVTVLCLVAFGFQAVAGSVLVECKETGGTSHLEWGGCGSDDSGRCLKPCDPKDSGEEPGAPGPCEDTPVKADVGTAAARSSSVAALFDLILPTFVAEYFAFIPLPLTVKTTRIEFRATPPPAVACIRTIVMLV